MTGGLSTTAGEYQFGFNTRILEIPLELSLIMVLVRGEKVVVDGYQ